MWTALFHQVSLAPERCPACSDSGQYHLCASTLCSHVPLSTLLSNRRSLVFIYMHTNLRLLLLAVICFFVEASQLSSAGLRPIEHCVSTRWGYSCFAPETRGALMRMPGRRIITGYLRVGSRGILAASCCWLAREIMRDVYTYGETFVERCRRDPHVLVFEAVADDTEQRSAK